MSIRLFFLLWAILGSGPSFAQANEGAQEKRNVLIEWEDVSGASSYEVQVSTKEDAKKKRFKSTTASLSANLKPGLYLMQVRAFDDRSVPGDWSPPAELKVKVLAAVPDEPKAGALIAARDPDHESVTFHWQKVPSADHYHITIQSKSSDWKKETDTGDDHLTMAVPVAEDFEWNVFALDHKGERGEENAAPLTFQVRGPKLDTPTVEKPLSKYVDEVTWTQSPHAQSYSYELIYRNPKTRKWKKVEAKEGITDPRIKFDISRPTGRYRLKVMAVADRRLPSAQSKMDFEMRGGFKDSAAFQTAILRDSFTKPTSWYAITSYLITQIQYSAANADANTTPAFKALGGTGRVGLGYQQEESDWGAFGIADMSGFSINGQNFNFASAEAHVTRKLELGQSGLLMVATGLFYKQLPVISGSDTIGFKGVGTISEIGPHLGFIYWLPITQRFGLQANARAYYSLSGSASDGVKALPSLSYQYGLLGSYRLSQSWTGYAGYAFRHDEANYPVNTANPNTFGTSGEINTIHIDGNYVNFILEYSF